MVAEQPSTQSKQPPSLFGLAFPSILANLLYSAVAIVQMKFVGMLGPEALAAIGVGQRVFFALQAVLMAVSAGTTALVARAWGGDDHDEASRVTMASLVAGGAFALAVTVPGILAASPVASIFGLDSHTTGLAASNIRWMSVFNLAFAVNFILGAALRAAGDAWSPLWIGAGVNVVNIPLLYVFVFGHYGFPEMGVAGAAVAGGISFSIGAAVMLAIWLGQGFRLKYVTNKWFRRERFERLLNIGYPAGVEVIVFQCGYFVFLMLIGHFYGTVAFAAYNVGSSLLMVCFVVGFGFSIAGATLAGQHLGANDPDGAVKSGWRSAGYAVVSMGVIGVAVAIFAPELAALLPGRRTGDHRTHGADGLHHGLHDAAARHRVRHRRRVAGRRRHALPADRDDGGTDRRALRAGRDLHVPGVARRLGLRRDDRRVPRQRRYARLALHVGAMEDGDRRAAGRKRRRAANAEGRPQCLNTRI